MRQVIVEREPDDPLRVGFETRELIGEQQAIAQIDLARHERVRIEQPLKLDRKSVV